MKKLSFIFAIAFASLFCATSCDNDATNEITKVMNTTEDTIQGVVDFSNLANEAYYWNYTKQNAWVSSDNPATDLVIPPFLNSKSYVTKYPHAMVFTPSTGTGVADSVTYYYYVEGKNVLGGQGTYSYSTSYNTLTLNVVSAFPDDATILETGTHEFKVMELTATNLRLQKSIINEWAELAKIVFASSAYSSYIPNIAIVTLYFEAVEYQ